MDNFELQDCPICGGTGLLEENDNYGFGVSCLDCGSRTVTIPFGNDKAESMNKAAMLWNSGKVIVESRGE